MERLGFQASAGGIKRGVRFDGVKYVSGDFALFVAQASSTTGSKEFMGVVAEVEYKPLQSIKKGTANPGGLQLQKAQHSSHRTAYHDF